MISLRSPRLLLLAFALAIATSPACAQSGPANALQGFSQNRDRPIKIDAATLEVHDKDKVATFSGNVQVVQGDTTLLCRTLAVFYDQEGTGNALTAAKPGPGGQQRIKRLEARGGVKVTQKDQTATGDTGVFDMASNTVTLNGNVVVTQGDNTLRGEKLTVNLTSGVSHVEAGNSTGGRVQGLFLPSTANQKPGEPKASTGSIPRDSNARETGPREVSPREGSNEQQNRSVRPSGLY